MFTTKTALIGLGSGLASAVLFYSAARGSVALKFVLLILTPLPTMIAGIGWGWTASLFAALAGIAIMASAAGTAFGIGFGLIIGAPAVLAAWLLDLGRRSRDDGPVEWLSEGEILGAVACCGGALPLLIAPLFGGSYAILKPDLTIFVRDLMTRLMRDLGNPPPTDTTVNSWTELMISALPATIASYWVLIFALNIYLAGRVALASGHLMRPWPNLHRLAPPPWLAAAFAVAILLTFLSGTPRLIGTSFSGAFTIAFLLIGLSVLHCISKGRVPWILWLSYTLLITPLGPYALIIIALIGLGEPLLRLRDRFSKPALPPAV